MSNPFSVLHFSTSDLEGGSARSAWRIHSGLKERNVRSKMLVSQKLSQSDDVQAVSGSKLDIYSNILLQKFGYQYTYVPAQHKIKAHPWVKEADIIQLFNVHGGYFNLSLLPKLAQRSKIVWRLSDLWPMTGHCAYPGDCEKWTTGCGHCPDLATYPGIGRDRTAALWQRKKKIFQDIDFCIVAPSSWTFQAAKQSPLFQNSDIRLIPNGIDVAKYQPIDQDKARQTLNIKTHKKVMLFCAHVAFDNPRKGTDILLKALHKLEHKEDVLLLVAGYQSEKWIEASPVECKSLGYLSNTQDILTANAAADFILSPSVVENLPNTIIEALAMAKPIIAFNSGGISDAVKEGETGIIVSQRAAEPLAKAIDDLLVNKEYIHHMSHQARALAEQEFDELVEVDRFKLLYEELLEQQK